MQGDSREVLKGLADNSIDSVVTDPPYALVSIGKRFGGPNAKAPTGDVYKRAVAGFMNATWDTGETAFDPLFWVEVLRVLKPGGHLIAFSGTRTYHRLACAIEDAGFEMRDMIAWLYGSGFPKSHDVSRGIDKAAGAVREVISQGEPVKRMIPGADQHKGGWEKNDGREFVPTVTAAASAASAAWEGWGTALKPALEPIVLARKPLIGTVAANVLRHGTGALNIDASRVGTGEGGGGGRDSNASAARRYADKGSTDFAPTPGPRGGDAKRRWPANVVHDGSDEVVDAFPFSAGQQGIVTGNEPSSPFANVYGDMPNRGGSAVPRGDTGSAARFFYSSKADAEDRCGSKHPTVKPVDLMAYLVRMVTPPGGVTLDPFAGSGSTGMACLREGFDCILIEREAQYVADIHKRLAHVEGADLPLFSENAA
ncbi:MAG: site-specific DNA-methyltransferase [Sphingomonadales bacterium]|nr:site-specific DNA-methyltransferase [Sphingomonadales bacterium]